MKKNTNRPRLICVILTIFLSTSIANCEKPIQNLLTDNLDNQFKKTLKEQQLTLNMPGVSAAIILPDNSKWLGVSGKSSDTLEVNSDMVFGLGSVTMTYTATLIFQLEKEELLSIQDTIGKYIEDLKGIDGSITISQLINHTSGLYTYQQKPDFLDIVFSQPDKIWTPTEIIETFQGEPECKPGECFAESAMDHVLLGVIIETLTGSTISNQFQTRIFNPLNLSRTFHYPQQSYSINNMAHFWWDNYGSSDLVDVFKENTSELPMASLFSSVWAAGAMHSTAENLAIFVKYLFEGKLLEQKSLKTMLTPITELDENIHYGYSIIIEQINGNIVYWHTGGFGYSSIYCYFPNDKLSIAVLCNQMKDPKPIALDLYNTYLEFLQ